MNNLGHRGRPAKKYKQEEIVNIVKMCREECKVIGLLKYSVVYKFALNLYEDGKIEYKLSEDFWRKPNRQGTIAIETINEILEETVQLDGSETEKTISTYDAVNKLFTGKEKDKKELINKLTLNEVKAKQYIRKNKQLNNKVKQLEEQILGLTEQRDKLREKADEMQIILFKFMEYSKMRGFPVENIFNTGQTRTAPVDLILSSMFGKNPTIGFDFEQYLNKKEKDNLTPIDSKRKKSAIDDYGLF